MVASEAAPYAKTGGLADVVGDLRRDAAEAVLQERAEVKKVARELLAKLRVVVWVLSTSSV